MKTLLCNIASLLLCSVAIATAGESKPSIVSSDNQFGDIASICSEQGPGVSLCSFQFTNATARKIQQIVFTVKGEPSYVCPYAEYEITITNISGQGGIQSGPQEPVELCTTDIHKLKAQVLSVKMSG